MIRIETMGDRVWATYTHGEYGEFASASGTTLAEAIVALSRRFEEMLEGAVEEMRARGFIRTEHVATAKGEPS